jgi:hypothetical protein
MRVTLEDVDLDKYIDPVLKQIVIMDNLVSLSNKLMIQSFSPDNDLNYHPILGCLKVLYNGCSLRIQVTGTDTVCDIYTPEGCHHMELVQEEREQFPWGKLLEHYLGRLNYKLINIAVNQQMYMKTFGAYYEQ